MYAALLLLVHQTHKQIEVHQKTIAEKNARLQQLSADNMRREESERKKFATELHEGLAQSLSAVKFALEDARGGERVKQGDALAAIIPELQNAIGHARAIATELRPPSLDELGLGPTLRRMCSEFAAEHPLVKVNYEFAADEASIPASLKISIYRIVETVLGIMSRHPNVTHMRIALQTSSRAITLLLEDDALLLVTAMRDEDDTLDPHSPFDMIHERVMVSRGILSIVNGAAGTPVLRAAWLM